MYAPLRVAIGWRVQLVDQYWKGEAPRTLPAHRRTAIAVLMAEPRSDPTFYKPK